MVGACNRDVQLPQLEGERLVLVDLRKVEIGRKSVRRMWLDKIWHTCSLKDVILDGRIWRSRIRDGTLVLIECYRVSFVSIIISTLLLPFFSILIFTCCFFYFVIVLYAVDTTFSPLFSIWFFSLLYFLFLLIWICSTWVDGLLEATFYSNKPVRLRTHHPS